MADTNMTKLAQLIDPEVMADMISAKLPNKIRVTPFAAVDASLQGVPGDTITIPKYGYVGDAVDVAEGEEVALSKMSTSTQKVTVKKAMKSIGLTDEAVLSGYGNPVGQANSQLAMAIASKADSDALDALMKATMSYDGSAGIISYNGIVDAVDKFEEEINTEKVMFVHPNQVTQLRKDPDFISADKYTGDVVMTGEVGKIANCRIVPSRKVKLAGGGVHLPDREAGAGRRDGGRAAGADHLPEAAGDGGERAQAADRDHGGDGERVLRGGADQRGEGGAGEVCEERAGGPRAHSVRKGGGGGWCAMSFTRRSTGGIRCQRQSLRHWRGTPPPSWRATSAFTW